MRHHVPAGRWSLAGTYAEKLFGAGPYIASDPGACLKIPGAIDGVNTSEIEIHLQDSQSLNPFVSQIQTEHCPVGAPNSASLHPSVQEARSPKIK
jgi:hypothetical protein